MLLLGQKLVDELGKEPRGDTLSAWMAHHIAELIRAAEESGPDGRADVEDRCRTAILQLWDYRMQLPNGKRPFEDSEPIHRAIASLDPADNTPRYFREARQSASNLDRDDEVHQYLEFADQADRVAKDLIRFALRKAASASGGHPEEWLSIANEVGTESELMEMYIRFISRSSDVDEETQTNQIEQKALERRIGRLNEFIGMVERMRDDLKGALLDAGM